MKKLNAEETLKNSRKNIKNLIQALEKEEKKILDETVWKKFVHGVLDIELALHLDEEIANRYIRTCRNYIQEKQYLKTAKFLQMYLSSVFIEK